MSQVQSAAKAAVPAINFVGAVVPYKPGIDKVAALAILQIYNECQLEGIDYWLKNDCPEEQFAVWAAKGYHPIDVGHRKYNTGVAGSATEYLVRELELPISKGARRVLELVNKNNKDGSLKMARFSVPQMLRIMYELSDDSAYHIDIINKAGEVLVAFMNVEDGEGIARDQKGMAEAMPDLVQQFAGCNYSPLTLGRYMRDLWILGTEPRDIREKLRFWTTGNSEAKNALAAGVAKFQGMRKQTQEFDCNGFKGITLWTDDRFLAGAAIKGGEYEIRVIVGSDKHTVVSTKKLDLSKVKQILDAKEPGLWFYQPATGALLNGSPQYIDVQPTKLQPGELIKLLRNHGPTKA